VAVDLTPIIEAYQNLLIVQYANKPKARATIALFAQQLLANGIYWDVQDAFDIDTAVGKQLDILGKYIGVDRFFTGENFPDDAFAFSDAQTSPLSESRGFIDAQNSSFESGIFLGTQDVIAPHQAMDDATYRLILQLKIIQNNINCSTKIINETLYNYFGLNIYMTDNYDMSITYHALTEDTLTFLKLALQKQVLPRPMGVQIDVVLGGDFYGFVDAATSFIDPNADGFIDATNSSPISGLFLSADEILD
jgi:hypothetical protein